MKKISFVLFAILLMLTGCKNDSENKVKIAVNLPLTGYIGVYGERMQTGMDLARKDLTDSMKKENIVLEFDYQDNRGETKDAITIFNKQIIQNPDIYMSGITAQTSAIQEQTRKAGILHFLWSWTPLYMEKGLNEFRSWLNFGAEAQMYVDYISKQSPKKLAYFHINNLGSKTQREQVVVPALKKHFPDLKVYAEEYPPTMTDFKNLIAKVKEFNPDVFIVSGYKESIINMIKDIDTYKIDRNKVYCSMDLLEAIDEVPDSIMEGFHVSAPEFNIPSMQTEKTKQWIEKFKKERKRNPVYTEAYGYDCVQSIFEAAKIAREENIPLSDALHKVSFDGITGHVSYSEAGDIENHLHTAVFKNGILIRE